MVRKVSTSTIAFAPYLGEDGAILRLEAPSVQPSIVNSHQAFQCSWSAAYTAAESRSGNESPGHCDPARVALGRGLRQCLFAPHVGADTRFAPLLGALAHRAHGHNTLTMSPLQPRSPEPANAEPLGVTPRSRDRRCLLVDVDRPLR